MELAQQTLPNIKATLHILTGKDGIDEDPANPIARATSRLFEQGKPIGESVFAIFGGRPEAADDTTGPRWLGVFSHSPRGLLVFFPPYNGTSGEYWKGNNQCWIMAVDHLTLNPDFEQWHASSLSSKEHQNIGPTQHLGARRYLWFGMSVVADEQVLPEVKRQTRVNSTCSAKDTKRRLEEFKKSFGSSKNAWVSLGRDSKTRFKKGFLHFGVIIGPTRFADLECDPGLPLQNPYWIDQPTELQLYFKRERFALTTEIDIQILSTWLPGSLRVPLLFTTRSKGRGE
jgi:hypothetical protein